ncbi:MAG: hypothetical protein K8R23_20640 [Chthoniobacter sp.]|nr:hypothetical protein [Chthoniobacter sp.]
MSTMKSQSAKIINHSEGLGMPSAETVRRRARELAQIDGREEHNEADWRAAKRELHGGHAHSDGNGDADLAEMISEHDMVSTSLGHQAAKLGFEDQESVAEELIAEGMDEAEHEQMLAARRARDDEDAEGEAEGEA